MEMQGNIFIIPCYHSFLDVADVFSVV